MVSSFVPCTYGRNREVAAWSYGFRSALHYTRRSRRDPFRLTARDEATINRCADVLTLDERADVVYDIFSSEWARCVKAVVLSSSTMFCGIGAQTFPSFTY